MCLLTFHHCEHLPNVECLPIMQMCSCLLWLPAAHSCNTYYIGTIIASTWLHGFFSPRNTLPIQIGLASWKIKARVSPAERVTLVEMRAKESKHPPEAFAAGNSAIIMSVSVVLRDITVRASKQTGSHCVWVFSPLFSFFPFKCACHTEFSSVWCTDINNQTTPVRISHLGRKKITGNYRRNASIQTSFPENVVRLSALQSKYLPRFHKPANKLW